MKNVAVFKAPTLKPLPGELTAAAIREAVLPVKIVAMSRAIAACTELPELCNYKKTVDGLAAAARTIKHEIPEQVAMLNRVAKEALFRLSDLLCEYKAGGSFETVVVSAREIKSPTGEKVRVESFEKKFKKSERIAAAEAVGIKKKEVYLLNRINKIPDSIRKEVLNNDEITSRKVKDNLFLRSAARDSTRSSSPMRMSDELLKIFSRGLNPALCALRGVSLDTLSRLDARDCKYVRVKIVQCQELFDAMEQRLSVAERKSA